VKVLNTLKDVTARFIRREYPPLTDLLWGDSFWSDSYLLASTGQVSLDMLKRSTWKDSSLLNYRFRLYASKRTEDLLFRRLDLCRWLYNRLLQELNAAKAEGRTLSQKDTQALIVRLKVEKPELGLVYSKVLQMANYQLWSNIRGLSAMKRNARKIGKLRFKGHWFKTLSYNQSGFRLEAKKLILSKVGAVNIKRHRLIEGPVKGVLVKRELSGKWFAVFQVERSATRSSQTERAIGLDVGLRHFLPESDGRQIENPKFYERSLERLRKAHRGLSRKKNVSKNRTKARVRVAGAYEKVVNQRDDFLHQLSRFYVNNYSVIAVEALNVTNMIRNRNPSRRILDASWSKFLRMLSYKAASAGGTVAKVNPRGTSREYRHGMLNRDYNASLNILERGLAGLGRPSVPVEVEPLLAAIPASVIVEAGSPHPSG
jgi:putative transposase